MRSKSLRKSLRLNIEPSPCNSELPISKVSPCSSRIGVGSAGTTPACSPGVIICSVLCLYDFDSDGPDLLPFRKSEILEVVRQETTGWWAAMRKNGDVVGWIPEAFVIPLAKEMAERLRRVCEASRIYEYEAENLYNPAPVSQLHEPGVLYSRRRPVERRRASSPLLPSHHAPQQPQDDLHPCETLNHNSLAPPPQPIGPQPPPSPSAPMPQPPLRSAPLNGYASPLPTDEVENRPRAGLFFSRSLRRHQLTLDDNTTLSELSMVLGPTNTRGTDRIASPDIACSSEVISQHSRSSKVRRRNESHDARFPNSSFQLVGNIPRYLRSTHSDQLDLDCDGNVRSGTLVAMIEKLTTESVDQDLSNPVPFSTMFLATFRTITTPDILFELLVERFRMSPPKNLSPADVEDWKSRYLLPTRKRVLDLFIAWLEQHQLLEEEAHIARHLTDFLLSSVTPVFPEEASNILQKIEQLTFSVPHGATLLVSSRKPRKSKAYKNDLLKMDYIDVAEQLALLEFQLYARVSSQECLAYAKTQTGNEVAKLNAFCSTHDKVGAWVKLSILSNETLVKRADTIDFWIKVAEKSRQLNNIASMSAIIIALSSVVITQLHFTWAHVGRKSHLDVLLRFNDPSGGFAGYRNLLQTIEGPCVPFVGMFLADIVRIREQFSDSPGQICFLQRQRWYETVSTMLKYQKHPYDIPFSQPTTTFIQNHLEEGILKEQTWFWKRSQRVQHSELAYADIRKGLEAAGF